MGTAPAGTAPVAAVTGSKWVPPVLQGNRKAWYGLGGGVVAAAVALTLVIVDPFAKETIPQGWEVRPEAEIVKSSVALPKDYVRTGFPDKGYVQFDDPSGVFTLFVTHKAKGSASTQSSDSVQVGTMEEETKKLTDYFKDTSNSQTYDLKFTTGNPGSHDGLEAREITVDYSPKSDGKGIRQLRRIQVVIDKDASALWKFEVWMPAAGDGRKNGDRLFEQANKYWQIKGK
ncbi:hypothetical protein [Streptomyces sp. NPDC001678]|uniref:hypothetical protein n=1 Tax=Streptomyces sp. NPDC001678 TaxID=3364599 RepID=UPI0036C22791